MLKPVYGRARGLALAGMVLALLAGAAPLHAQSGDHVILAASEAFRLKDDARLSSLRASALAEHHPLAMWVDYWQLSNRLATVSVDEVEAFYARWRGSYVEDRLRNDWLLELGRRRDWRALAADYPRFRMNDDREVSCFALLAEHLLGKDVSESGRNAWFNQREADDGCALLAATLYGGQLIGEDQVWRRARLAIEANKPGAAQQALALIGPRAANDITELIDQPTRYLGRLIVNTAQDRELATLALLRLAGNDPELAATALKARWEAVLPADLSARVWATVAMQSALKLMPEALDDYQRAESLASQSKPEFEWPDEALAWKARAALRAADGQPRWPVVLQAINAMSAREQRDSAWVYWKARALLALAKDSGQSEAQAAQARELLGGIAGQLSFYGALAAEELGQPIALPPPPAPLTPAERAAAASEPGLARALQLVALGLRNEGAREWNYTLRGMTERALLAAAQLACEHEVWDRCINTSERTRVEVDMAQRYPMPYRRELQARSREFGIELAYVYGLIRQESRFVMDAHSSVGATGLMQLMPGTARWTAKRLGLRYSHSMLTERDTNLQLGTHYLRLLLDDFDGSQLMAAAAYNAGPIRSRRWREGPTLEAAVWAENLPFRETRDYVKRVLTNTVYYAALLADPPAAQAPSLKERLGTAVGPAAGPLSALTKDLP